MIISGLLITGGYGSGSERLSSTELWSPGLTSSPVTCTLPPMARPRSRHSLSGGLACGGFGAGTEDSCEVFTGAGWELLDSRLSEGRWLHSAWLQPTTNTTFLIGGAGNSSISKSVDTVTTTGRVARPDLTLKHDV